MGCGEIEPFIGKHWILRYAMALVIDQAESGLRKHIALPGGALIKVGGRIIGLRYAEAVFIQEAQQCLCPGIAAQRQRPQRVDGANIVNTVRQTALKPTP
jgi:hypothetical protein